MLGLELCKIVNLGRLLTFIEFQSLTVKL